MNLVLRFYQQNQIKRRNSQAMQTDGSSTEATVKEGYRYEKAASYDKIFYHNLVQGLSQILTSHFELLHESEPETFA